MTERLAIPDQVWVFRAQLVRIVDGDTQDILIDQGMHCRRVERLRLLGVDCPEVRGETRLAGLAATAWVSEWYAVTIMAGEWPLIVQTTKSDNFGRYLARVWSVWNHGCLNDDVLASGHAVVYQ